jgi:hypothetical protein
MEVPRVRRDRSSKSTTVMPPAYERDDGPLSARQIATVRKLAASRKPKGAMKRKQSLF